MSEAMQDIQGCQCDLSIIQKQFVSVIAQGTDFCAFSVALCCYITRRMPSDVMYGNSDASFGTLCCGLCLIKITMADLVAAISILYKMLKDMQWEH